MSCGCGSDSFAARARSRIAIQQFTATDDGYGGRTEVWADVATVPAIVEPKGGREVWLNSQLQSRVDAVVTIRYRSDMADTTEAAKRRLALGSRLYNVQAIRNVHRDMKTEGKAYQIIFCTEGEPT